MRYRPPHPPLGLIRLADTPQLGLRVSPTDVDAALRNGQLQAWGYRPNSTKLCMIAPDFWQWASLDPVRCFRRGRSPIADRTSYMEVVRYETLLVSDEEWRQVFGIEPVSAPIAVAIAKPKRTWWNRLLGVVRQRLALVSRDAV